LQTLTENAVRLSVNSDLSLPEALAEVAEATRAADSLRKQLQAPDALPLSDIEFDKRMTEIRSVADRKGFGESSPVESLNELQADARKSLQGKGLSKLVEASGRTEGSILSDKVTPEFLKELNANPEKLDAIVEKFSSRQVALDKIERKGLSAILGKVTGKFGLEETRSEVATGKIAPEAGVKRAGRIRGARTGLAAGLIIPLLLALRGGGGGDDQPEEPNPSQLFMQEQLRQQQAKLNSQLSLSDARRSKTDAQAQGQLLTNLLLMQKVSGGDGTGFALP